MKFNKKPFAPVTGTDAFLVPDEPCDIVIYTQKWTDNHASAPDEQPTSLIHSRVFVNGKEIVRQAGISLRFGNDFTEVDLHLIASDVKVIPLDRDEWEAFEA